MLGPDILANIHSSKQRFQVKMNEDELGALFICVRHSVHIHPFWPIFIF